MAAHKILGQAPMSNAITEIVAFSCFQENLLPHPLESCMAKTKPNLIATLNFRTATRPVKTPVKQPREVVLDYIDQQIALATADMEGRELTVERVRYVKD